MKRAHTQDAVSPLVGIFLIIILVLALGGIIVATTFGLTDKLYETPYVAATADAKMIPLKSMEVIEFTPLAGASYKISEAGNPAKRMDSKAEVSFMLIAPGGGHHQVSLEQDHSIESSYGRSVYIYSGFGRDYRVTDSLESIDKSRASEFEIGRWLLQVVDLRSNQLLGSIPVQLNGISTSAPKIWWNFGTGWNVTNSSGALLPRTDVGNVISNAYGGPGNSTSVTLDGNSYVQVADNADLNFDEDMSISLWIKPSRLTGPSPYFNIVGKGQADIDNYDLFIVNGQLWFEWTQPGGQHYHVQTTNAALNTVDWHYIAVVIENQGIKLYQGKNQLNLNWYNSPVIGSPPIAGPVPVILQPNDSPLHIGRQDHGAWDFMFEGDIGEIAFYPYGLSPDDISYNVDTFKT